MGVHETILMMNNDFMAELANIEELVNDTARERLVVALVRPFVDQVLTNLRNHDYRDQDLTHFTKCQILFNSHHGTTNPGPMSQNPVTKF